MLDHEEVVRLYGPWKHRTPQDASALLRGYAGRWWVAGGWAIDAFVGSDREHGDLDLGVPREEVKEFVAFVSSSLDVWAASGSLTPILPSHDPQLSDKCGNLWLRRSGAEPWEYDILLEDVRGATWHYKRDPRLTKQLEGCLWKREGITYLRPEIQLLLKSKHCRAKDTLDLQRCLPYLDEMSAVWLEDSLRQQNPDHQWLRLLTLHAGLRDQVPRSTPKH